MEESEMELKKFFMEQLEREGVASRKAIERVPEGKNTWKPHAKSMELGYLAALTATMPGWIGMMIRTDEYDLADPNRHRPKAMETRAELLAALEKALADSRQALNDTTEEHLMKHWKLRMGEMVMSDQPRYAALMDGAITHLAHHRGQLTVYLRLLESSVPAIYGPSADER
jgi:uncharacterized damage-inducible protein DinB